MDDDDDNESKKHTLDTTNDIKHKTATIKMKLKLIQPEPEIKNLIEKFVENNTFVMHMSSRVIFCQ